MKAVFILLIAATFAPMPTAAEEKYKLAVYPCEFYDTSGGGDPTDKKRDRQRVEMVSRILKDGMATLPFYQLVDTSKADEVDSPDAWFAADGLFRECNGCEAEITRLLGADLSMACVVQKVSNLILSINLYMRDSKSERLVANYSASMRGNTDTTWKRSAEWLLKNRLATPPKMPKENR